MLAAGELVCYDKGEMKIYSCARRTFAGRANYDCSPHARGGVLSLEK